METAEKVQYQAALAVTGGWQGSSRSQLCEKLGWEFSSDRRWCRRILQIHEILNNKTPSYLQNKLHRRRIQAITFKSSRYMDSFSLMELWNNVIGHFPNIPFINILKCHILSLVRPIRLR